MNHNSSAVLAISPSYRNNSVYQKTFGFNDFYLSDGAGGPPLGNVQLLGRVSGTILKANLRRLPERVLDLVSSHAIDFYAMSEDVPEPRKPGHGGRRPCRAAMAAHQLERPSQAGREAQIGAEGGRLSDRACARLRQAHALASVRHGAGWATIRRQAPLDTFCRAWDHPNLYVVDAGCLPTSAAVNPALTIAAQALRVAGAHCRQGWLFMTVRQTKPVALVTGGRRGIGLGIASALAQAGFDIALTDIADPDEKAKNSPIAQLRKLGAEPLYLRADLADLERPSRDRRFRAVAFRPSRLPRQQCRHGVGRTRRLPGPRAREFRRRDGDQSARHRLLHAGGGAGNARPGRVGAPLDHQHHLGVGRAELARAARLLHQQGRPRFLHARAGAAARRARHCGVRGAAGHHPDRHDGRRIGEI